MPALQRYARHCRATFRGGGPLEERLVKMALELAVLVRDGEFVAATFDGQSPDKRVLHHDPETDIYILAHVFRPGVGGNPHSHAPSWALYANARGATHMREYERRDAADASHSELKVVDRYTMRPGDARAYPAHAIHSPHHDEIAWVVRVTGGDLDLLDRWRFKKGRDVIIDR